MRDQENIINAGKNENTEKGLSAMGRLEVSQETLSSQDINSRKLEILTDEEIEDSIRGNASFFLSNYYLDGVDTANIGTWHDKWVDIDPIFICNNHFNNMEFNNVDFSYASLEDNRFYHCSFDHADMIKCKFNNAVFYDCTFKNCNFNSSDFENVRMYQVHTEKTTFSDVNFTQAKLRDCVFGTDTLLRKSDFQNTEINGVNFEDSKIGRNYNIDSIKVSFSGKNGEEVEGYKNKVMDAMNRPYQNYPEMKGADNRLFVDMDGTLAEFKHVDTFETLYEKGYFLNLKPITNTVAAIRTIINDYPEIEVYTLSAVLPDSKYALNEKNAWLDMYLPEVDGTHRLYLKNGENKAEYVEKRMGLGNKDFLLDDYTSNLLDWVPPGRGIKALNGINHTKGTWQSSKLSNIRQSDSLADAICKCMAGEEISDLKAVAPIKPLVPQVEI